jgi:hypothetical protein
MSVQEVDNGYDLERMRTDQPMTASIEPTMAPIASTMAPIVPTTAPIEPTMDPIVYGAYILFSIQKNNILRSHQILFTATEEECLCDESDDDFVSNNEDTLSSLLPGMVTSTAATADLNDLQVLLMTVEQEEKMHANHLPVPVNYHEKKMIDPVSRFTFVARHLSEYSGEPFRHFLDLEIQEHRKIADAYRCIRQACSREGFELFNEEELTGHGAMVVFNFADEMIPVAVEMWESCLSKEQNLPIKSCVQIVLQR